MVLANAAVSAETAGSRANEFQERRHGDRRRHNAGAREGVSGDLRKGRRVLQRRAIHSVSLSRRRRAAAKHHHLSRQRRTQLGRYGGGSADRNRFRANPRSSAKRLGGEKT